MVNNTEYNLNHDLSDDVSELTEVTFTEAENRLREAMILLNYVPENNQEQSGPMYLNVYLMPNYVVPTTQLHQGDVIMARQCEVWYHEFLMDVNISTDRVLVRWEWPGHPDEWLDADRVAVFVDTFACGPRRPTRRGRGRINRFTPNQD